MIYKYDFEKDNDNPESTTLSSYIIQGNYHLFWSHWMVSIFHLRDVEGIKPAIKNFKAATHQIVICAYIGLEKGEQAEIKLENNIVISLTGRRLTPLDLDKQIGTLNDDQALRVFDKFVQGIRSPDVDLRSENCKLIDSIVKFEKNLN